VVRKILFREYGTMPVDRILAVFFPPPPEPVRTLDLSHAKDGHVEITIPKAYLFFRGHFDGAPMLPGVTQLTEVVLPLVRQLDPDVGPIRGLRRVRFRRPIFPGDTILVDVRREGASYLFEIRVGTATVASGAMLFEAR
jgi:3-hydroxymyristoyl/3-hydroxydecanoyl-(acyl carrier protein) dehydratase